MLFICQIKRESEDVSKFFSFAVSLFIIIDHHQRRHHFV